MRRIISGLLAFGLLFALAACTTPEEKTPALTDREGRPIEAPAQVERIISGNAASTEILAHLGLLDKVVAVDLYGADVTGLPAGLPAIDMLNPDAEAIIQLNADLLLASNMTRQGTDDDPFAAVASVGTTVAYIPTAASFADIYADIRFIAALTGTTEKGEEVVQNMQAQVAEIARQAQTITEPKTVYFELSPAPDLYTLGNNTYIHEMITLIGAQNIFGDQSEWLKVSEESVILANPAVILTVTNFIDDPIGEIKGRPAWENIQAVADNAVYYIDNNSSQRPSPNLIDALWEMALAVYPDVFQK